MASGTPKFSLNHMAAPRLPVQEFFSLARSLGIADVEIRNDLAGNAIADGTPAAAIRAMAKQAGVTILSINALQRFNDWNEQREKEAVELAVYAAASGAKALVLVPVNDGSGRTDGERQRNLDLALKRLKPILDGRGLVGLVEPLGFEICSLRSKREAAEAIRAVGGDSFRLVHDTFHHHLAGEAELFPDQTGLVHISGVTDASVSVGEMRDSHRVLVGPRDRLGNIEQIAALLDSGYSGPFSFEPFAEEAQALETPWEAGRQSMDFIRAGIITAPPDPKDLRSGGGKGK